MYSYFFFTDPATTEIYTLSLHDALPICGRRRAVLGLVHHEVVVLEVDRHAESLALQRVRERGVHIEVEGVAVLVGLAHRFGLDTGGEVLGLVRPEARLADASQEVLQGTVPEEIDALL